MTISYSKTTNGFYDSAHTYASPPTDLVPVADADYQLLLLAMSRGAALRASSTGTPEAVSEQGAGSVIDLSTVTASSNYAAPVSLATQAASALAAARTYVSNNYTMLNEATPAEWVTYLKALMAIEDGTDTTSTALPAAPARKDQQT